MRQFLMLSCLLLVACDSSHTLSTKEATLKPLTKTAANLAFSCVHENIPEASSESNVLFQYARWLQKNNLLKQDEKVNAEVERLYRISSENDHHKATINLQNGAIRGTFKLRSEEQLRMSQQLIDAGVASGYYFVGILLQHGSAGLKKITNRRCSTTARQLMRECARSSFSRRQAGAD